MGHLEKKKKKRDVKKFTAFHKEGEAK